MGVNNDRKPFAYIFGEKKKNDKDSSVITKERLEEIKKEAEKLFEDNGGKVKNGKMKIVLEDGAIMPTRAHRTDAGLDLYAREGATVPAGSTAVFDTGVHIAIPDGYVGLLTSKSGLMRKYGITCRGTIDCGYTGSIQAVMFNHGKEDYYVHAGDKITQLVILPVLLNELERVDSLEDTERGSGGFGSTGR